jgi:hypothetical protein
VDADGIFDLAGNPASGTTNESWTMILEIPDTPANLKITPDLGISSSDGLTSTNNIVFSGTVGATNLSVPILDASTGTSLGHAMVVGTNWSIPLTFTVEGAHKLQANAVDIAGNVSLAAFFNLFLDVVPPTAIIQQVTKTPYVIVTNITVAFNKGINPATIAAANFSVTRNGSNSFTPTLSEVATNIYSIGNLAAYTTPLGTYQVTLNLSGIQDYAGNVNTNIVTMTWTNATTNLPPVLGVISNRVVAPLTAVQFTVPATDPNGDKLSYALVTNTLAHASLNSSNGLFTWTPSLAYAETTNTVTISVTDNGLPPMSTNQSFQIVVLDYLAVSLGMTNIQAGQSAMIPVFVNSDAGVTNLTFTLPVPPDTLTNFTLSASSSQLATATAQPQSTNVLITFTAKSGQTLQGPQLLSQLNFTGLTDVPSAFVTLLPQNIVGLKPTGLTYSNTVPTAGVVELVENQPLMLATAGSGGTINLELFGKTGTNYVLQSSANLLDSLWLNVTNYTQTNPIVTITLPMFNPYLYYRVVQQ